MKYKIVQDPTRLQEHIFEWDRKMDVEEVSDGNKGTKLTAEALKKLASLRSSEKDKMPLIAAVSTLGTEMDILPEKIKDELKRNQLMALSRVLSPQVADLDLLSEEGEIFLQVQSLRDQLKEVLSQGDAKVRAEFFSKFNQLDSLTRWAFLNSTDAQERTPLHEVAAAKDAELCRLFLEKDFEKIAVNQPDINGDRPLHCLIKNSKSLSEEFYLVYQILIENYAEEDLENKEGKSFKDIFTESGFDYIKFLDEVMPRMGVDQGAIGELKFKYYVEHRVRRNPAAMEKELSEICIKGNVSDDGISAFYVKKEKALKLSKEEKDELLSNHNYRTQYSDAGNAGLVRIENLQEAKFRIGDEMMTIAQVAVHYKMMGLLQSIIDNPKLKSLGLKATEKYPALALSVFLENLSLSTKRNDELGDKVERMMDKARNDYELGSQTWYKIQYDVNGHKMNMLHLLCHFGILKTDAIPEKVFEELVKEKTSEGATALGLFLKYHLDNNSMEEASKEEVFMRLVNHASSEDLRNLRVKVSGEDINILQIACRFGMTKLITELTKSGKMDSSFAPLLNDKISFNGDTALHMLLKQAHESSDELITAITSLINCGADPKAKNNERITPRDLGKEFSGIWDNWRGKNPVTKALKQRPEIVLKEVADDQNVMKDFPEEAVLESKSIQVEGGIVLTGATGLGATVTSNLPPR